MMGQALFALLVCFGMSAALGVSAGEGGFPPFGQLLLWACFGYWQQLATTTNPLVVKHPCTECTPTCPAVP